MALMGGLVETRSDQVSGPNRTAIGEWMVRNAWPLLLGASALFWGAVVALLTIG